jgi:lysophospholipase L1-like esterase
MRALVLRVVRVLGWLLPSWPAGLLVILGSRWRLGILLGVWLGLAAANVLVPRRRHDHSMPIYSTHLALACVPFVLSSIWLLTGPVSSVGSVTLVAWSSVLPAAYRTLWKALGERTSAWGWTEAVVLPAVSVIVALLAFEVAGLTFLAHDPFAGSVAVNSPDRSYWYVVRKVAPDGTALAATYGFVGPEPEPTYMGLRVLVIGDSIPATGWDVNFPKVAETILARNGRQVEVVNAAIMGFSLEQMKRFYTERLATLRHDILVVSFYLDDINRELRYRKRNQLYTPSWPEWMQDLYYRCFVCRTLLAASGFTEGAFLLYRRRGQAESFPVALRTLDEIRAVAVQRGAAVALLNVPIFDWKGVLATISAYQFKDLHAAIEAWARDRGVHYRDLLPALVGRDIRPLRRSDTDIHFNDEGHRVVGAELERLIDQVIERERLHDPVTPTRS